MLLASDPSVDCDVAHLLGDELRTIICQGPTCNHQINGVGSRRSICGLVALNYARLSLKFEVGNEGLALLWPRLISQATMQDAMSIVEWDELKGTTDLDINGLLDVPFFQETLATKAAMDKFETIEDLKYLFLKWFRDRSAEVHAVVLSSDAEVVVCISIPSSGSHIYSLFDSHPRPDHDNGPAYTISSRLDDIMKRLHDILLQPNMLSNQISSPKPNLSAYLLELKEGAKLDIRDLLARSATYLSRRRMGADDTIASSFIGSEHILSLRLRGESLRKSSVQENSDSVPDASLRGKRRSLVEPRRNSEFAWQLSLLLESTPVPLIISSDSDGGIEKQNESSALCGSPFRLESTHNENDPYSPRNRDSWLPSLAQESTNTVWLSSENSVKQPAYPEAELFLEKNGTWEAALIQQLQEEEEISASLSHHISSEHTWLVALQKRLQEEDDVKSTRVTSPSFFRSDLDWQLAIQLQQQGFGDEAHEMGSEDMRPFGESEIEDSVITARRRLSQNYLQVTPGRGSEGTFPLETLDFPRQIPEPSFECSICTEMHLSRDKISLPECDHKFCNACLTTFTKTKIEEGRYPIFCPECLTQRVRATKNRVTQNIIDKLGLSTTELRRLEELQLRAHSITIECLRCCQSIKIDREQYGEQSVIVCPLPQCGHKWCKSCLKTLASSQETHRCKNGNIDRLMRKKGWKYCPGCRTPVQKESGCNHMTCGAPGCNTHFCYRCGVLMIDTTNGGDVGTAVTEHYLNCRLFEKRLKCSIQ